MEPQTEFMLNLKKICAEELLIDLNLNEIPEDGGVYAELGPILTKKYIRMGQGKHEVPILFMCKHSKEPECLNALGRICNYFEKVRRIADGETYRVLTKSIQSGPHKSGRTEDGQAVYSCIINFTLVY